MSAIELKTYLQELQSERALASIAVEIAEIDDEITAVREAYVGAAVTEIAELRAELSGPLLG